jgi:antitoxin HicB
MKRDKLNLEQYPFTVRPLTADEGGGYRVEFPDVPLCMTDGETVEEAIANASNGWGWIRSRPGSDIFLWA